MSWFEQAACRGQDTNLWFPDSPAHHRAAVAVCDGCPVKDECLDYSVAYGLIDGIYGGLSERARRPYRKAARKVPKNAFCERCGGAYLRENPSSQSRYCAGCRELVRREARMRHKERGKLREAV